jgi:hypothetical protein
MAGGQPTPDAVAGLFASPPEARGARGPGGFRWRALAAGAVVLVCIGGSFAFHFARASQARALMASGALSARYEERETRPAERTAPVAPSAKAAEPPDAAPPDAAPAATPTRPAPIKRPGQAGARRPGSRKTRPSARPRAARTTGRLPRQIIARVVGRQRGAIGACYRKGLASNPRLKGRVRVKIVIGSSGAVTSARDAGSSLPDRRVVGCIVGQMRRLRFPAPRGGNATVVYPFDLHP